MRFDSLQETLTRAGFSVHTFPTGQAAKDWLAAQWSGKTIGLGGSLTLEDLGLYEALSQGNTVYWHWRTPGAATLAPVSDTHVRDGVRLRAKAPSIHMIRVDIQAEVSPIVGSAKQ